MSFSRFFFLNSAKLCTSFSEQFTCVENTMSPSVVWWISLLSCGLFVVCSCCNCLNSTCPVFLSFIPTLVIWWMGRNCLLSKTKVFILIIIPSLQYWWSQADRFQILSTHSYEVGGQEKRGARLSITLLPIPSWSSSSSPGPSSLHEFLSAPPPTSW